MSQTEYMEYRKVGQTVGGAYQVVIPKHFMNRLDIGKGDYVKVFLDSNKIIIHKVR